MWEILWGPDLLTSPYNSLHHIFLPFHLSCHFFILACCSLFSFSAWILLRKDVKLVTHCCSKCCFYPFIPHSTHSILLLRHLSVSSSPLLSVHVEVEVRTLCSHGLFFAGEIKLQFISDPLNMRDGNVLQPTYCTELSAHNCAWFAFINAKVRQSTHTHTKKILISVDEDG